MRLWYSTKTQEDTLLNQYNSKLIKFVLASFLHPFHLMLLIASSPFYILTWSIPDFSILLNRILTTTHMNPMADPIAKSYTDTDPRCTQKVISVTRSIWLVSFLPSTVMEGTWENVTTTDLKPTATKWVTKCIWRRENVRSSLTNGKTFSWENLQSMSIWLSNSSGNGTNSRISSWMVMNLMESTVHSLANITYRKKN